MPRRRTWAALVVVGAPIAGSVVWRRVTGRGREHVDLYFADGSMVSLGESSPDGTRLLELTRRIRSAARASA